MAVQKSTREFWETFTKTLDDSRVTKGIRSVDPFLSGLGSKLESHLQRVVLTIPLIFIMHQWFLLSPTSDYRIIEIFMIILRHAGAAILFGFWIIPPKNIIPLYIAVGINLIYGWLLELNYWMYQNEANGICTTWWGDREVPWWTLSLCTFTFQLLYIFYLNQKFDACQTWAVADGVIISVSFIPHLFSMSTIFISVSTPIFYWFTKILFIAPGTGLVLYYGSQSGVPLRNITQQELTQLNPGKWFIRDFLIGFTLLFYGLCITVDIIRLYPSSIFSLSYLTTFIGHWCTSFVIVAGLSAAFGFLSNLLFALSRFLVTGQKESATVVFDVNIGQRVNLAMSLFCLEAGILIVDDETRIQNFNGFIFLTFYVIIAQVWDMTEQQCYNVANSGENRKIVAYLRVLIFAVVITSVPTIVTFKAATYLELDLWMLLNVSGTVVIVCRAFCSLIELILGFLAWHVDNHLDKVEDLIYFTRLFKNLTTAATSLMLGYHRLFAPFFSAWFWFRLIFVTCQAIGVGKLLVYKELAGFQNRRKFLKRLSTVPDATEEQLREVNDVCYICFAEMDEGKVLQCSHIFHNACLRKWFQLRTTCPVCNEVVF